MPELDAELSQLEESRDCLRLDIRLEGSVAKPEAVGRDVLFALPHGVGVRAAAAFLFIMLDLILLLADGGKEGLRTNW